MKKTVFFPLVMLLILCSTVAKAQLYYKVTTVMDSDFEELSESSQLYKKYIGKILTVTQMPQTLELYVKIGMLPSVGPYPFAGYDDQGNNIYAFTDMYGNVMYTDFAGNLNYVATANDFSVINYSVSFDNVVLGGIPATLDEFNAMIWEDANQRAQLGGGIGGNTYTAPEQSSGGMSEQWYRSTYAKWEGTAKSIYDSLTRGGVQTTDRDGKHRGYSDWGNTSSETRMKTLFADAQRQMRDIRNEASRYGYVIPMSSWETATIR